MAEICFCLGNVVVSDNFYHLKCVLEHQFLLPNVIIKGISASSGSYCREALTCAQSILDVFTNDQYKVLIEQFVLSGQRLQLLMAALVQCFNESKTESLLKLCFKVTRSCLQYGETIQMEFEKNKGLDALENLQTRGNNTCYTLS